MHNPEYRLKSRGGQDRSVNQRYARTTDKGNQNGWIYSLLCSDNLKNKLQLTQRAHIRWAGQLMVAQPRKFGAFTALT